jgi:hypothetical protein
MMTKLSAAGLLAAAFLAGAPLAAQAAPGAPITPSSDPAVTLVAGGCGPGFHRTPWGGCRPNRWGYGWRPGWRAYGGWGHHHGWGHRHYRRW